MPNYDKIFIGPLIHCSDSGELLIHEHAKVAVTEDGKIRSVDLEKEPIKNINGFQIKQLQPGQFIVPGFIDCHVHAVQFPNLGIGYDKPLLDWLDEYTLPLEKQYCDAKFAEKVFDLVVQRTLKMGTTTACYFASIFGDTSLTLAEKVHAYGQRAFVGKVNMNAPHKNGYTESSESSLRDTEEFVKNVRKIGSSLVEPIITPRFAISCDMELMKNLSKLAKEHDLHIQTHISENLEEIEVVKSMFSDHSTYAGVYDAAGLLTNKTVLAHGVHLTNEELSIIRNRKTAVIHCPSSNTCLRSGLCNVRRLMNAGVKVGLGTDVSGGNFPSILDVIRSTLEVSIHLSMTKNLDKSYVPLNYKEAFYLATLGGAKALAIGDKVGNFKPGKDFDALIIDLNSNDSAIDNFKEYSLEERLQRFLYSGDDRNIIEAYVAGKCVVKRLA